MARISANLDDYTPMTAVPEKIYKAHVSAIKATDDNGQPLRGKKSGNLMLELTHTIDEDPYTGREIRFDNIVYAGTDKNKKPISPFRLVDLIEATGAAWECEACHSGLRRTSFIKGKGENGFEKGYYYCPDCKQKAQISVDTDQIVGCPLLIAVSIEPDLKGNDRNTIKAYAPMV